MRISVIVLVYENIDYLSRNIKSIFMQNHNDIEIIVQDDGSTSFNINDIKKHFINVPQNIKRYVISSNENNMGTVVNYNIALDKAKGDIIVPLACDDFFLNENVLTKIEKFFLENKEYKVCTACYKYENLGTVYPSKEDCLLLQNNETEIIQTRLYISNFISGSVLFWKRDFLIEIGKFDTTYILVEDYPIVLKLLELGYHIGFIDMIAINKGKDGVSGREKVIKGKNGKIKKDAKRVKDQYVMSNLYRLERKTRRLIKACYELEFSDYHYVSVIKYLDVWMQVLIKYVVDKKIKKIPFDVSHIIKIYKE